MAQAIRAQGPGVADQVMARGSQERPLCRDYRLARAGGVHPANP